MTPPSEQACLSARSASPQPRSRAVDALRGVALLGIIIVNAPFFFSRSALNPSFAGLHDAFAFWLTNAFFSAKFFLIFSFLFGFGFAVSMRPPSGQGGRIARRLFGLFVFGLLHGIFFFFGDILMLYAVLGLVLWATSTWQPRRLLLAAGLAYGLAILCQATILTAALLDPMPPAVGAGYLGSFGEGVRQRLSDLPDSLTFILVFNGPPALAMVWSGSALGRLGLFPPEERLRARLRSSARWALLLGGLGSAAIMAFATASPVSPGAPGAPAATVWLAAAAFATSAPILSFGIAFTVLQWAERERETRLVRALAETGGASLSGYLLHSVILAAVASGWGFGLYGALDAAHCLLLALATFALIAAAINLWKLRFLYGPDEWLLRSFVALRWQPLRRTRQPR